MHWLLRITIVHASDMVHGHLVLNCFSWTCLEYCKRITFADVLFFGPLAVESLRQIKYTAKCKCAIKWIQINHQIKSTLNSRKFKNSQISYTLNTIYHWILYIYSNLLTLSNPEWEVLIMKFYTFMYKVNFIWGIMDRKQGLSFKLSR